LTVPICFNESSLERISPALNGFLSHLYNTSSRISENIHRKVASFNVSADPIIFNEAGLQVAVVENGVVHQRKIAVVCDLGREVKNLERREAGRPRGAQSGSRSGEGSKVRTGLDAKGVMLPMGIRRDGASRTDCLPCA
jgi:hypothetical protein